MAQYIYQFLPGERPELAVDLSAWTAEDELISSAHYEYLRQATDKGQVILAGRSSDGLGPAVVIFEAADDDEALRFMNEDPFVASGLFGASLHLFRVALLRDESPG